MSIVLTLAYLFFVGSTFGWILELVYRNLTQPQEKLVNPGFCTGPYLPIYGFGLCALFLLASLERYGLIKNPFWNRIALLLVMSAGMTVIEYASGIFCLKCLNVRLWDYSCFWGNIQGVICPQFSTVWAILSAIYYFLIHPHILDGLQWLASDLAFSFFIGMFFGVFLIDFTQSAQLAMKLKNYAKDNAVIIKYEVLKEHIRSAHQNSTAKYRFFLPFRGEKPLADYLKEIQSPLEKRFERVKNKK